MNNQRRKEIKRIENDISFIINCDNIDVSEITFIITDIQFLLEEEEWCLFNVPENLAYSEMVSRMENSIESFNEVIELLDDFVTNTGDNENIKNNNSIKEFLRNIIDILTLIRVS